METIKVKALPLEMDRLQQRENMEVEMCRLCFTLALGQQAVTNSPYAREFNNFSFIEVQIGFELPTNVCGQCLVQLNQLGSFLKMCKDAFNTYKQMKRGSQNLQPIVQVNSDVDDIKQETIDYESEEMFETSMDIADESEKLFAKFSEQETFFESVTQPQTTKTEPSGDDTSSDHLFCDDTNMEENMNKETRTCPACGVSVTTLLSHYSKNPKCGPRNSHCPTCNLYFGNKHRLLLHQKTHHPDEVSTSLMCYICSKTFQYPESLSEHLQTHDNDKQDVCSQSGNDSALSNLIPKNSKREYEKCYRNFKDWCNKENVKTVSENILLAYLMEKSRILKSPSLWSIYSMLKCMLNIRDGIDIRKFLKLVPFLKKKSVGYQAKKSKVFTREQINLFLEKANDENYLLWKVVLIMGISGAMRRDELTEMTVDNIQDANSVLIVTVPGIKTDTWRTFTVTNLDFIRLYRKYAALRPKHVVNHRLFYRYNNGKCSAQVVGVNTIGKIPSLIAKFLGLPNSKEYTGHCFRRTSATLLTNSGADMTGLKRHGGWRSSTIAESYVEDSIENKKKQIQSNSGSAVSSSNPSACAD